MLAGASRDTLPYDRRDVLPMAIDKLESDDWTIQRADSVAGRIVTHWKPLKHVLARLLLGQVMASKGTSEKVRREFISYRAHHFEQSGNRNLLHVHGYVRFGIGRESSDGACHHELALADGRCAGEISTVGGLAR